MATVLDMPKPIPWTPPMPIYRFTVEQYHTMIEAGILTTDDHVELLEGWIVPKMPHKPPHDGTIWLLQTQLLPVLPKKWILRIQSAITTSDSEPEPDLAIARGPGKLYLTEHPRPQDIGVLIEVSDTTLLTDRGPKLRLYAAAKIPCYWIVNLLESQIEVHTQPKGGRKPSYRHVEIYDMGNVPLVLDGVEVASLPVNEILP